MDMDFDLDFLDDISRNIVSNELVQGNDTFMQYQNHNILQQQPQQQQQQPLQISSVHQQHKNESYELIIRNLQIEKESLEAKLLSFNKSALEVKTLYDNERKECEHFRSKTDQLIKEVEDLRLQIGKLENELLKNELLLEKEKSDLEDQISEKIYSDIGPKYVNLVKTLQEYHLLDSKISKEYTEVKRKLNKFHIKVPDAIKKERKEKKGKDKKQSNQVSIIDEKIEMKNSDENMTICNAPASYEKQNKNNKKEMISRGTQYVTSTTTRAASTSAFIKTNDVGTNFPEIIPISLEDILKETIYSIPSPISPINDIYLQANKICSNDPPTYLSRYTQTIISEFSKRSVSTCTKLKNIRKRIEIVKGNLISEELLNNNCPQSRSILQKIKNESPCGSTQNLNFPEERCLNSSPLSSLIDDVKIDQNILQQPGLTELWNLLGQTIFALISASGNSQFTQSQINILNERMDLLNRELQLEMNHKLNLLAAGKNIIAGKHKVDGSIYNEILSDVCLKDSSQNSRILSTSVPYSKRIEIDKIPKNRNPAEEEEADSDENIQEAQNSNYNKSLSSSESSEDCLENDRLIGEINDISQVSRTISIEINKTTEETTASEKETERNVFPIHLKLCHSGHLENNIRESVIINLSTTHQQSELLEDGIEIESEQKCSEKEDDIIKEMQLKPSTELETRLMRSQEDFINLEQISIQAQLQEEVETGQMKTHQKPCIVEKEIQNGLQKESILMEEKISLEPPQESHLNEKEIRMKLTGEFCTDTEEIRMDLDASLDEPSSPSSPSPSSSPSIFSPDKIKDDRDKQRRNSADYVLKFTSKEGNLNFANCIRSEISETHEKDNNSRCLKVNEKLSDVKTTVEMKEKDFSMIENTNEQTEFSAVDAILDLFPPGKIKKTKISCSKLVKKNIISNFSKRNKMRKSIRNLCDDKRIPFSEKPKDSSNNRNFKSSDNNLETEKLKNSPEQLTSNAKSEGKSSDVKLKLRNLICNKIEEQSFESKSVFRKRKNSDTETEKTSKLRGDLELNSSTDSEVDLKINSPSKNSKNLELNSKKRYFLRERKLSINGETNSSNNLESSMKSSKHIKNLVKNVITSKMKSKNQSTLLNNEKEVNEQHLSVLDKVKKKCSQNMSSSDDNKTENKSARFEIQDGKLPLVSSPNTMDIKRIDFKTPPSRKYKQFSEDSDDSSDVEYLCNISPETRKKKELQKLNKIFSELTSDITMISSLSESSENSDANSPVKKSEEHTPQNHHSIKTLVSQSESFNDNFKEIPKVSILHPPVTTPIDMTTYLTVYSSSKHVLKEISASSCNISEEESILSEDEENQLNIVIDDNNSEESETPYRKNLVEFIEDSPASPQITCNEVIENFESSSIIPLTRKTISHQNIEKVESKNSKLHSIIGHLLNNFSPEKHLNLMKSKTNNKKCFKNLDIHKKFAIFLETYLKNHKNSLNANDLVAKYKEFIYKNKNYEIFYSILIEIVQDIPPKSENNSTEADKIGFRSPFPEVTESHMKVMELLKILKCHKIIEDNFENILIHEIEERIFTFKSDKISIQILTNLTLFYIAIINLKSYFPSSAAGELTQEQQKLNEKNLINPARLFISKCLYYYNRKAMVMIFYILKSFPFVLPRKGDSSYDNSDALISTIQCILNSYIYDLYNVDLKHREIYNILKWKLNYDRMKPNRDELCENLIAKIQQNKLKNVSYCFAILCKWNGIEWTETNCLWKYIIPLLMDFYNNLIEFNEIKEMNTTSFPQQLQDWSKSNNDNEKIATLLECLSFILKPFPVNHDISKYLIIFIRFLNGSENSIIQEAAVCGLLRISRFSYTDCFNAICNWKPSYEISEKTRKILKSFLYRKPSTFWKALENQLIF